ncbi:MAG: S8 family serine peptidase [Verrucomicrobiae bacterium]|nr:S8 family serine peptidase [Verrucomicrobiae bacterium]
MFSTRCLILFALFSVGFTVAALAQPKPIRLRNELIDTASGTNRAMLAGQLHTKTAVSGLYLLQFNGPLAPDQRTELKGLGVELIRYVPEDAFIARLEKVSPATVGALNYVHWIGPYQTRHKIQSRLAEIAPKAAQSNETVNVNILLSPGATPAELAAVKSHLLVLYNTSHLRQGIILRGELSPGQLTALAQSPAVLWIERASKRKLVDEAASKIVGGDDGQVATRTVTQQLGFDGSGVTVCVADTGLDTGDTNTMHPDLLGRVTGFQFYSPLTDGSDGYGHGTHCAGIVAGNAATGETDPDFGTFYGLGVASGASIYVERIFDSDANEVDFTSDETLTHDAVRHGAKIGSNSWGNDVQGDYDTDCAQFDELVRDADAGTPGYQPYILEFSAGNAGPASQTIGSPAGAKNVIATGASENVPGTLAQTYGLYADGIDTMADFSSRGPCADGRIKPDLVAPGSWIASAASRAAPNEDAIAWSPIDDFYVFMGGTSMSGPHAAGAAAVFVQFYQATHTNAVPSPALVKAALINSADELDESNGGPGPVPNNDEGWGRINLVNIITTNFTTAPRAYQYVDQTTLLTNGQVYTQHIFVRSAGEPLKVTLAYTDVPGFPGALPALVNDLDLEVVAPDGTLYRGNQFGAGESVPNAPTPDKLNNVEGIYLTAPAPGDYQVRVRGTKIVQDALTNTAAIDQDFALVSSGDLARPGQGLILLDRPSYSAPGVMQMLVLDAARAASNTVSVLVTNLTAHRSLTNVLHAAGNYGAFTGTVATVTGTAGAGQLQIANGDSLEVDYIDAGAVKRSATAVGDFIPPSITSVGVTTDLGVLTITWTTTEPATSLVRYGTNSANLNLAVTNTALVTSHSVKLTRLIPGKTYYFLIGATDAAGNSGTNNNSGADFTFTGLATPTVLLVDDYDTTAEEANGATVIPDGSYTNVLAAAGVSFGFWKVNTRGGSPQLADLQPFPVVIWRTTDDIVYYGLDTDGLPDPTATNNTLNPKQQFMIQSYLNGGGAFFMSSLNILTELGDVPFRQNVLQVGGFIENPAPPEPNPDGDEDFGVPAILGAPGTLASGLNQTLDYTSYPIFDDGIGDVFGPDFSDTFTPASGATPITLESVSGKPCGMSFPAVGADSPGRVVFLSYPLDTMPTNGAAPNNAVSFMRNVIQFLVPGLNGIGVVHLDSAFYTTNAVATVEVGDSDLAGTGQTTVTFGASSRTNRTTVTLFETTHPGLFHGFITLVAGVAGTNQLRVQNADTLTATYFDASNGSNVTATATVDTVPPVISQVASVTDFANALVTWRTSKPADSSVQYSESPLPDRVVYASQLVTNHALTITGLAANRVYYYQVVSTDAAGNTTVDDNHGNLYSFQTLKAPAPPWFDDLEGGAPGWSVVPYSGSDINWTLGKPNNGLETSAYSGTNAWGSNLNGQSPSTLASSFLYSPVIDLSGVSTATLTFESSYDFTSGLEAGQLGISTNSATPPIAVATLVDYSGMASGGWEQETVDLTPYAGQTIQVVWFYLGLEGHGWLVDDVGITGVPAAGKIHITKNLGQGTWSLSAVSPIGTIPVQTGVAPSVTISNLAAGQYLVEFGDVQYYQTPPDQTNTLAAGGTLNFTGNYDFPDVNNNKISDAWEMEKFGTLSTNRTQKTDTDHDGMTDYAEFIAGTDPTNAASRLYFTGENKKAGGLIQLQWPVVTNRLYQVNISSNLLGWQPVTAWWQASNNPTMTFTATNNGKTGFYRVQVMP